MKSNIHNLSSRVKTYRLFIGIDVGVNTETAIWDNILKQFINIETVANHIAMDLVKESIKTHGDEVFVRVEDARLRKWFGDAGREKLQGAGSVTAVFGRIFLKT